MSTKIKSRVLPIKHGLTSSRKNVFVRSFVNTSGRFKTVLIYSQVGKWASKKLRGS